MSVIRIRTVLIPVGSIAFLEDRGAGGVVHLRESCQVNGVVSVSVPADDWPGVVEQVERAAAGNRPMVPARRSRGVKRAQA